jgi:hypothetical protein
LLTVKLLKLHKFIVRTVKVSNYKHKTPTIMMKNRVYLKKNGRHPFRIPLMVLFVSLLTFNITDAKGDDVKPNGNNITVSGYVTCQGERISDVLIEAVSTSEETISDKEGKFSIEVVKGGVITFQKDGYVTYEYLADEPRDNMVICLQVVVEPEENSEAVIIIHTKKE